MNFFMRMASGSFILTVSMSLVKSGAITEPMSIFMTGALSMAAVIGSSIAIDLAFNKNN